ncbi:TPA: TVP38/TMEM64 family protein [Kluyvera ascorbata]|nr:TVP38/TMEM64 family protein [Kluyvera ascorbata]HAT3943439.1 TVP38/TMEM64 family protein [Kluyvera ascorbata]HAT3948685.1 TVP38/TMEM64 family protein [Kluyvera ascorbata]
MVAVVALLSFLIHRIGLIELVTHLRQLQDTVQQSGAMGYALYITLFVLASLCLLPGSVLVLAAGMVFGPWLGTLLSLIAATVASALSFLLARGLGRALVLKYVGHTRTFQAIERGIAHSGIDFLILTRLIPLFPYNIQNYAYGLTSMPFWSYTLVSALTTLPGIVIYTLMASKLAAEGITLTFVLQLSLAGLVLFALVQAAKAYARHKHIALAEEDEK